MPCVVAAARTHLRRLDLGLGFLLRRRKLGDHLRLRLQHVLLLGRESHRGARLVSLREGLERVARRVCVMAGAQAREQKIGRVHLGCAFNFRVRRAIGRHVVVVLAPGDAREVQARHSEI